jgi:hypothetical protein
MTIQGIDYAWGRPDPGAIKRAGYAFALRYLAVGGPSVSGKVIGLAERQALHAAGLGVGLVWETSQMRPLDGAAAGKADGQTARAMAHDLGFPDGFSIFGAVDFNPPASQYPIIADYLRAAGFDCYANAGTCQYMADHGICKHFWQHDWGGGTFGRRHLHQRGQVSVGGAQVDVNDAYETCCIWFPHSQSVPQPQPHPLIEPVHYEGDNVTKVSVNVPTLDDQGNGNVPIPGVAGRVISVSMNGNDPNHEGYRGVKPFFSWSDRGSDVLLVIEGGKPRAGFDLNVWVAG